MITANTAMLKDQTIEDMIEETIEAEGNDMSLREVIDLNRSLDDALLVIESTIYDLQNENEALKIEVASLQQELMQVQS